MYFCSCKEGLGENYRSDTRDGGGWNPVFTRSFKDWEVEEGERLLCDIRRLVLVDEWRPGEMVGDEGGGFSCELVFKTLHSKFHELFPWQVVWR